jgi:hypothetical protein
MMAPRMKSRKKSPLWKTDPVDFLLSVLSPKQRFEAAMRIAREAFHDTGLTNEDIEAAVQRVRRKNRAPVGDDRRCGCEVDPKGSS